MAFSEHPDVSIVIPVFSVGEHLGQRLAQLEAYVQKTTFGCELVLVNDGSSADDHEVLFDFAKERTAVHYVRHEKNEGKGRTVADGVAVATAPIVVFTDIDLPYDLSVITQMYGRLTHDARLSFVVGSRHHPESIIKRPYGIGRRLASRLFSALARRVASGSFTDVQCGCKAFRRDTARLLFSDLLIQRFAFDTELFLRARQYGLRYAEMPVIFCHAEASTVRVIPAAIHMVRDLARLYVRYGKNKS